MNAVKEYLFISHAQNFLKNIMAGPEECYRDLNNLLLFCFVKDPENCPLLLTAQLRQLCQTKLTFPTCSARVLLTSSKEKLWQKLYTFMTGIRFVGVCVGVFP